jgi:two-component system sensor histidine kinase UhpB
VAVHVQADSELRLPIRMEAELFRIAQEALTNTRKHAHARSVEVGLRKRGQTVVLSIKDDGRGVQKSADSHQGQGLIGMRERARLLGGSLQVVSKGGTRVTARVPAP